MPFSLQQRRFASTVTRFLGLTGHIPLTLVEDLLPVLLIADPADKTQWRLRDERLGCAQVLQAGVAAQFSEAVLINPPQSGHVAELLYANLVPAAAATINLYMFAGAAGLGGSSNNADPLLTGDDVAPGGSALRVATRTTAVANSSHGLWGSSTQLTLFLFPFTLGPGFSLAFQCGTVNVGFNATIYWRDRPLLESELSPG